MKMTTRLFSTLFALTATVLITGFSGKAEALSGTVSGTWYAFNHSGNYCDSTLQDCTGSYYPKSLYDTYQPYRNARVEVWQGSNVIGVGATNSSGFFSVAWTSSTTTNTYVRVFAQQKDGRFTFHNTAGQRYNNNTSTFTLSSSGTTLIGNLYAGSSSIPDAVVSDYYMAEIQWRTSLGLVGSLINSYTGIEIRGYANSIPGFLNTCNTSCANGTKIQLDASAMYQVQGRIMHESGHVASGLLDSHLNGGDYCWPSTGSSCTWSLGTPEWAAASFEEAFATFTADSTLWSPDAVEPTSCLSSNRCDHTVDGNLIELTHYPYNTNNCSLNVNNPEARWPISTMRYLWDIYDNHNDADGDTIAEGWSNYWRMYGNVANYPSGTSTGQKDEPWNSAYTTIDDYDGRGAILYQNRYSAQYSLSTSILRVDNCSPK